MSSMSGIDVGVERGYNATLRASRDQIIHLVPLGPYLRDRRMIAHCGFDCSGRQPKPGATVTCIVCLDIRAGNRYG